MTDEKKHSSSTFQIPHSLFGTPDVEYMVAPDCFGGGKVHELEEFGKPWYRRCVVCGHKFALIADTVLEAIGITIVERPITPQ